jgi:hypothetical protein
MSEWGRGGGQVPRNEAAQREHLKEVQEDLQRDRQADRVAKAHHKRPWWQFWRSRHEPPPDHKSGPDAGDGRATHQQPPHPPPPGPGTIGTGV